MVLPALPCYPCVVNYSLSAALKESEYIGFGFKGMPWNRLESPLRPNYFGMTTEWVHRDDVSTSEGPMLIAYSSSSGACLREMKVERYLSHPVDIEANPSLMNWQVERAGGRLQVHFSKQEWWGVTAEHISLSASFLRIQWAIGNVHPDGSCQEAFGYHSEKRGMSALNWFNFHTSCRETEEILNNSINNDSAPMVEEMPASEEIRNNSINNDSVPVVEELPASGTQKLMLRGALTAMMLWLTMCS